MRRRYAPLLLVALVGAPATAHAEEQRLSAGLELGYAAPMGGLEAGSRVGDVAFGVVPIGARLGYRLSRRLEVAVVGAYGVGIPTLCANVSDCQASLGRDLVVGTRLAWTLGSLGPTTPSLEAGIGYEWLHTSFTDNGVTSSRTYAGPVLAAVAAFAPFRLGRRWSLGPAVGTSLGVFRSARFETPAGSVEGDVASREVHAWWTVAVRTVVVF